MIVYTFNRESFLVRFHFKRGETRNDLSDRFYSGGLGRLTFTHGLPHSGRHSTLLLGFLFFFFTFVFSPTRFASD